MSNLELEKLQNFLKTQQIKLQAVSTVLLFLSIAILVCNRAESQPTGGGYSGSYLLRDVGARPIALAGAYTAIVNEASAIYYNPAGLSFLSPQPLFTTMYSFLEYGRKHAAIAYAQSVTDDLGIGIGFNSFSSGSFIGRDIKGNPTNNMYTFAYSLVGSASYRIELASLGASVKYISDRLYGSDVIGTGYSVDLGMKFDVAGLFSFGMAVQDLSGMIEWNTDNGGSQMLPYTIRAGVAMEYGFNEENYAARSEITGEVQDYFIPATQYLILSLDVYMRQYERSPKLIIAAEASLHELFALRAGIGIYGEKFGEPMLFPLNVWGGGFTIRPRFDDMPFKMNIEYGLSPDRIAQTGVAHHLSLVFEF